MILQTRTPNRLIKLVASILVAGVLVSAQLNAMQPFHTNTSNKNNKGKEPDQTVTYAGWRVKNNKLTLELRLLKQFPELIEGLGQRYPHITEIHIERGPGQLRLSGADLKYLARVFKSIQILDLSNLSLRNWDISYLENFAELTELCLNNNPLDSLQLLQRAHTNNPNAFAKLTRIDLSGTRINPDSLAEIQAIFPLGTAINFSPNQHLLNLKRKRKNERSSETSTFTIQTRSSSSSSGSSSSSSTSSNTSTHLSTEQESLTLNEPNIPISGSVVAHLLIHYVLYTGQKLSNLTIEGRSIAHAALEYANLEALEFILTLEPELLNSTMHPSGSTILQLALALQSNLPYTLRLQLFNVMVRISAANDLSAQILQSPEQLRTIIGLVDSNTLQILVGSINDEALRAVLQEFLHVPHASNTSLLNGLIQANPLRVLRIIREIEEQRRAQTTQPVLAIPLNAPSIAAPARLETATLRIPEPRRAASNPYYPFFFGPLGL